MGGTLADQIAAVLRWETRPAHLLIEASGVARPACIADVMRVSPALAPAAIVCLVDVPAFERRLADPWIGETVLAQVVEAHALLANKTAALDDRERERRLGRLRALNPNARPTLAPEGMVTDAALTSFSLRFDASADLPELAALLIAHGDVLVRAKGILLCGGGRPEGRVLQYAGGAVQTVPTSGRPSPCRLVCIGHDGPRFAALREALRRRLDVRPDPATSS